VKQSELLYKKEIFPGSVIMSMRSFLVAFTEGEVCPFLSNDCFECLPPHEITE
jgi:hypothetical protein